MERVIHRLVLCNKLALLPIAWHNYLTKQNKNAKIKTMTSTKKDKSKTAKNKAEEAAEKEKAPSYIQARNRIFEQVMEIATQEDSVEVLIKTKSGKVEKKTFTGTRTQVVLEILYQKAKSGDMAAIKEWNNRVMGLPGQTIVHAAEGEGSKQLGDTLMTTPVLQKLVRNYAEELKLSMIEGKEIGTKTKTSERIKK